jgi:hypothetical protein
VSLKPDLGDVLIYARSKDGRAEGKLGEFFQIADMEFNSRDSAMTTATQVARKRQVAIWIVTAGAEPELVRSYRAPAPRST